MRDKHPPREPAADQRRQAPKQQLAQRRKPEEIAERGKGKTGHSGESAGFHDEQGSEKAQRRQSLNLPAVGFLPPRLDTSRSRAILIRMLDWSSCHAVERSPETVSGAWVFRGTRVPVSALFENLEDGARVDDFVEWFPGVTKEQVEAVLEHANKSLVVA
jgi:uncharacterized protein (DUF433 family)